MSLNLKKIKPGDDVDAVVLQNNFEEIEKAIGVNTSAIGSNFTQINSVLNQLNETDTKNKEALLESIASNADTVTSNNTLFKSNFEKINGRPFVIEFSDKSLMPSWYRKWSNGFIEMGGIGAKFSNKNTGASTTIALPFVVEDVDACIIQVSGKPSTMNVDDSLWIYSLVNTLKEETIITELKLYITNKGASDASFSVTPHWQVSGYLKDIPKEEDITLPTEPKKEEEEE